MEVMTVPADSRRGLRRIALFAALSVVIGGLFALAYLHASAVASCLNDQLARRNAPTAADAAAHIAYAQVQERYDSAVADLTAAIIKKEPVTEIRPLFTNVVALAHDKKVASVTYVSTLISDQAYRDTHKLGSC
jgi:hypothetical protein